MALARHDQKRLKAALLIGLVFHVLLFAFFSFYKWDRHVKSPVHGALLVEIGDQRVIPQVQNPASEVPQPQTTPETTAPDAVPQTSSPASSAAATPERTSSPPAATGGQTSVPPPNETQAKPVTDPFAPVPLREIVGTPGAATGTSPATTASSSTGVGSGVNLEVLDDLARPGNPSATTPASTTSAPGVSTTILLEGGGKVTLTGAQGRRLESSPAAKPVFPSEIPQGLLTVEFQVDDLGNIRTNNLKVSFDRGTLPQTTLVHSALKMALDQWKFSSAPGSAPVSVSVTFIVEKN